MIAFYHNLCKSEEESHPKNFLEENEEKVQTLIHIRLANCWSVWVALTPLRQLYAKLMHAHLKKKPWSSVWIILSSSCQCTDFPWSHNTLY